MISVPGCIYDIDPETDIPVSQAEMFVLIGGTWVPAKRIKFQEDSSRMICAVVIGTEEELMTPIDDNWMWDDEFRDVYPELFDAAVQYEGSTQ